ncbi:hypothetical protein QT711_17835 [Sporosarcina saromensis]|uniref:Uncharacterized protein n=1 Tax=Sporosarcina saromensis TaxID=359365 RepID=A0ABU4GDG4_9BACL|nr:hypothetical protein [Sporosarcina saromensis]MDW0115025.1 hypothetical protein [Sporosarcina saromensis]
MSRRLLTDKERLEELYAKELELKRTQPIGSSPLLAHLSYQILLLEKKLKISNPDRQFVCIENKKGACARLNSVNSLQLYIDKTELS